MSETNRKVVANIQKQLESAKVWANTSNSNPHEKNVKGALLHTTKMHGD